MEGRGGRRLRGVGDAGRPQAALDVSQDVAQLDLGLLARPAGIGAAERDEVPAPVGPETQREDAAALALALDDLACGPLRRGYLLAACVAPAMRQSGSGEQTAKLLRHRRQRACLRGVTE